MPKSKPVQVGSVLFPNKKAAKDHVRGIIARYKNGETIAGGDDAFLRDLILLHSEAEEKIESGISHFTVDLDREFRKTRCIVIVRHDGSSTDTSCVKNCIDGKDHKADVMAALRHAVSNEIKTFKKMPLGPARRPFARI